MFENSTNQELLTERAWELVDQLADEFERAWIAGTSPSIEEWLERAGEPERPALLEELVRLDLEYRLRAGEMVEIEEYLARFPDLSDVTGLVPELRHLRERVTSAFWQLRGELPGYEILEELGRGGMGIVWKARQTKLNRLVAIKMMHADRLPLERQRFFHEARAIAELQHPGIVELFEYGDLRGIPYLILEHCAGGSLEKRLAGGPLPPREAAHVVEQLARAVEVAHVRGIVHRDLKPANVLLAFSHVSSDDVSAVKNLSSAILKISDFGLAKRLTASGGTQTGAVLGTPAYFSPEQARGDADVGPATDVYALGAILYQCLTGRPPFQAATVHETVRLVLDTEPVPLRIVQPGTPRDLETICLKCLDKLPERRYATAADLADDLRRFLDGDSIRARRPSLGERIVRWARRSPASALLVAVLMVGVVVGTAGVLAYVHALQARAELSEKLDEELRLKSELNEQLEQALQQQTQLAERTNELAGRLSNVAGAFREAGQNDRMLATYQELASVLRELTKLYPDNVVYRSNLGQTLVNLGRATASKDRKLAIEIYHEAIAELTKARAMPWPENLMGLDRRTMHLRNAHQNRAVSLSILGRYREAMPDWDRAVELSSGRYRDLLRLDRTKAKVRGGDLEQAIADADRLRSTFAKDANATFALSAICARAALMAGASSAAAGYADQAMELLQQANALGAFQSEVNRRVLQEEDFNSLRGRNDFQKFLKALPGASLKGK